MNSEIRNLDGLIAAAANTKADQDYEILFAALVGAELFFNISTATKSGSAGTSGSKPTPLSTPLVDVGHGLRAVALYTAKENSNLKKPFGGVTWQKALEMVSRMPDADGVVLRSSGTAWVAIDKKRALMLSDALKG